MSVFVCQSVLQEGDSSSEADQENSGTPLLALFHSSSTRRSTSPSRSSSQALLPDSALSALRSAVTNKTLQLQVTCWHLCTQSQKSPTQKGGGTASSVGLCLQDVRGRLLSSQSSIQQLRKQLSESDLAKREAEQRIQSLQRERDAAQRDKETTLKEKERLKEDRDVLARSADTYRCSHRVSTPPYKHSCD